MCKNNGYSICFNEWLFDNRIKNELHILLLISSLCAKEGYCFATNSYFAEKFNSDEITISRKIKKLEKLNYINIIYTKRGCEVQKREIRLTKLYIDEQKNQSSVDKNVNPTIDENVKDNNTSINSTRYNIKENIKEKINIDLSFIENKEFLDLVNKWLLYRKDIKKPYKSNESIRQFYYKLMKLSNNDIDTATEIINNSIANEYQGIFALKTNKFTNNFTNNFERIY